MSATRKPFHLCGMTEAHVRIAYHLIRIHGRSIKPEPDSVLDMYGNLIGELEYAGFSTLSAFVMGYRREYVLGLSTAQARAEMIHRCSSARLWRQVIYTPYKRGR